MLQARTMHQPRAASSHAIPQDHRRANDRKKLVGKQMVAA